MKILAITPVVDYFEIAKTAIDSLECDTYVISDNPEFKGDINNTEKKYCNGSWNIGMKHFLNNDYDWLVFHSSDVIMQKNWIKKVPFRKKEIYFPTLAKSFETLEEELREEKLLEGQPAGFTFILSREAVEIVFPIPEKLKLWFGDEYIIRKLRNRGYKIVQTSACAYHYGSISVSNSKTSHKVIEEDKLEWEKLCKTNFLN